MNEKQNFISRPVWYVDQEERVIPASAVDRHHVAFPRDQFKHRKGLQFRSLGGMVHRISIAGHRELHASVEAPPPISQKLIDNITHNQQNMGDLDPLTRLNYTINYLGCLADSGGQVSREADELLWNLIEQRTYIQLGKVTLLEDI